MKIKKAKKQVEKANLIVLASDIKQLTTDIFSVKELKHIKTQFIENKIKDFTFNKLNRVIFLSIINLSESFSKDAELFRAKGSALCKQVNDYKIEKIEVCSLCPEVFPLITFAEGMALSNYQFIPYKTDQSTQHSLAEITLVDEKISKKEVERLNILVQSVYRTRDWVNMPLSHLNATQLSELMQEEGKKRGVHVEVFSKKKIEALKMGGLLAVNSGSIDPPTFTIMEWKPKEVVNKKPIILVGKGVVFDTGGMNIKTANYMNDMKMDMAGAATMANTLLAVAEAKLPIHMIALIPATDNRVNGNAYVTGDVITMYDKTTVEVLNTDAEGRLILADALSYAKKYDPQLVIDAATLTGAAARAIGFYGVVAMGNSEDDMLLLKESGENVYERIAEFPFWDEYKEDLKSDIADIKNLGKPEGGAIHAGKFLEHFTNYPYIHLDIAGVAFTHSAEKYHGKGATGIGVRLLFDFFSNYKVEK